MTTKPRRRFGLLVIVGIVLIGIGYGFAPRSQSVEIERVRRGTLRTTLREEGKTRVVDRYEVSAPIAGIATRVDLEVGDDVEVGQPLLQLDPLPSMNLDARSRAEAEARLESRRAQVEAANQEIAAAAAEAELASAKFRRLEELFAEGNASEQEVDDARAADRRATAQQKSAEFRAAVAEHELVAARAALARLTIRDPENASLERVPITSPVDGRVLQLMRESEGVVAAGEPLIEVGDPNQLEIEVEVLSSDAVRLAPGGRVRIDRWGGEDPLEGRVRSIEPFGFTKVSALGVEEQRVRVIVDFVTDVSQRERLGDGYRVEAIFTVWEGEDVKQIPTSALFRHRGGWSVYAVDNGRARLRSVEVGHRTGLHAEIISGLDDGESVIVHPPDSVEDGSRVRARAE